MFCYLITLLALNKSVQVITLPVLVPRVLVHPPSLLPLSVLSVFSSEISSYHQGNSCFYHMPDLTLSLIQNPQTQHLMKKQQRAKSNFGSGIKVNGRIWASFLPNEQHLFFFRKTKRQSQKLFLFVNKFGHSCSA